MTYRRITEKQLSFLLKLRDQKGLQDRFSPEQAALLSVESASKWIDKALTLPDVVGTPPNPNAIADPMLNPLRPHEDDVPAGRYAIEEDGVLKFFRVDRPTEGRWAGWVFLKIQASDELYRVKDPARCEFIFKAIAHDPRAASERYGHELGQCGVCGRTLTDPVSIKNGIGPVCADRMGWGW